MIFLSKHKDHCTFFVAKMFRKSLNPFGGLRIPADVAFCFMPGARTLRTRSKVGCTGTPLLHFEIVD
jgi:hypothetical protein